jgi:ribosomal protein S18 acetylase RimI-like enzyme
MVVQIRNFIEGDMLVLVKLLNGAYKDSYEFTPYTDESVNFQIQKRGMKILMAEENGRILGAGSYRDSHWGEEIEWLGVPEGENRIFIEDLLVRELEKFVKGDSVFTGVDAESPRIDEWAHRGYVPDNGLYHMVASLTGTIALPQTPKNVVIRSLRPNEEREFVDLVNKGFGWERIKLGEIDRWKTDSPPFDESWIQVAELSGRLVSTVVAKPDTTYIKFFCGNRGYLGPAATLAECRGQNLASALTCKTMNILFERGVASVALYTSERNAASVALLHKLGFGINHHWRFMRKNLKTQR